MNRNYFVKKDSTDEISIKVMVSTQGSADTFVTKRRSGGSNELLIESPMHDGIIEKKSIGVSNILASSVLEITTMINLQNVPKENWQAAFDNLSIDYTMYGGADGIQEFEFDKDDIAKDKSGQFIIVSKPVKIVNL
jgi:hypothetical protein